jgi:hypothetical protein
VEDGAHLISNIQFRRHVEVNAAAGAIRDYFLHFWPDNEAAISRADFSRLVAFIGNGLLSTTPTMFPEDWDDELRTKFNQLRLIRGSALNNAVGQERDGGRFHLFKGPHVPQASAISYDFTRPAVAPPEALFCSVRALLWMLRSAVPPARALCDTVELGERYTLHLLREAELTARTTKQQNKRKGGGGRGRTSKGARQEGRIGAPGRDGANDEQGIVFWMSVALPRVFSRLRLWYHS